jgi:hypothetical protein
MNKKLILTSLVVLVLLSGLAKAVWDIILQDNFERSDIPPWQDTCCYRSDGSKTCGDGSNWCFGQRIAEIISGKVYLFAEPNNLTSIRYTFPTRIKDFNWHVEIHNYDEEVTIFEWQSEGYTVQIRLNRKRNMIEYVEDDIYSQYLMSEYPYTVDSQVPYNFGTGARVWDVNITKNGLNVRVYINGTKVLDVTSSEEIYANSIIMASFSPTVSTSTSFDNVVFVSTSVTKQTPTVTISVSPDYIVTYGTQTTVSCTVEPPNLRLHLYYFQTEVSIPYTAVLPMGNNYFRCESEETDQYYSAFDSTIVQVTGVGTTTTIIPPHVPPSPIENASKPIPQLVNEEEWRNAGFGWALIFFSPIGLITMFSLIISAVVARIAGVVFGVVAFMFIWFILVLFTGILPDWLFIVLVIVAGFITANALRQYVFGGK